MQREQRNYLLERLGRCSVYEHSTYARDQDDVPIEVRQARAVIDKWEKRIAKEATAKNRVIKRDYNKVREVIMGDDYEAALTMLRSFEASHDAK